MSGYITATGQERIGTFSREYMQMTYHDLTVKIGRDTRPPTKEDRCLYFPYGKCVNQHKGCVSKQGDFCKLHEGA